MEVTIPIIMMTQQGTELKRDISVSVIEKKEAMFLGGLRTLKQWKGAVFHEENKLKFT